MNPTDDAPARPTISFKSTLIKIGLLFSLFAFIFLLVLLNSVLPWWLLIILALPIYLASEKYWTALFSNSHGWSTQQVGFSPMRILIGVGFVLVVSASFYFLLK